MAEFEYEVPGGVLKLQEHPGYLGLTGLSGLVGDLEVPGEIRGLPVKKIGKKAFLSKKTLRTVSLPDTIEEIEDWAFAYCDHLREVRLKNRQLRFGKAVFLDCRELRSLTLPEAQCGTGEFLAAAAKVPEGYYLLDPEGAGRKEWQEKWDAWMVATLNREDMDGYSKQVLCGEEDYGSTDMEAYRSSSRRKKVRLLLLRLLFPRGLDVALRERMETYLRTHTKGCESQESWTVILEEHGNDREYYELFTRLGCLTKDNIGGIIEDIGEQYPEMKAFFLDYRGIHFTTRDFFEELEL